jgi:hypothetical protein
MRDLACRAAIRNTPLLCRIHVIRAGAIVFRRHDGLLIAFRFIVGVHSGSLDREARGEKEAKALLEELAV